MARPLRPHLPGAAYHITTRTQGKVPHFTPDVRSAILAILSTTLTGTDVRLLAVAVMPNHLHLVMQQGQVPIGRILQPGLTRIARLVQRVHGVTDHVFGKRFHAQPIFDPDYLRTAIVYVHLNPVRAKLCIEPTSYGWTSHNLYASGRASDWPDANLARLFALEATLPLFAVGRSRRRADLRKGYRAFIQSRIEADTVLAIGSNGSQDARIPVSYDASPVEEFAPLFRSPTCVSVIAKRGAVPPRVPEPREIAAEVLRTLAPGLQVDDVRGRFGGPRSAALRRAIIERMNSLGYSGVQIASWLRVHPAAVSRTLRSVRAANSLTA